MAVINGFGGAVDGIGSIKKWSVNCSADLKKEVLSNTDGAPVTKAGNKDWTGSFECTGHTPVKLPGTKFTFSGSLDGTNGITGPAIIDQVVITIDIEGGNIISYTSSFSGDGAPTKGAVAVVDKSLPDVFTSVGCKLELGTADATPSYTELPNVRTITITLSRANTSYVDSSTGGYTKRNKGNLDCTVAIAVYTDDFDALPDEGDFGALKIYVDATKFWEIQFVQFADVSDCTCDLSSKEPIGCTLNASFTAYVDIDGTMTKGGLNAPGAVAVWPEVA